MKNPQSKDTPSHRKKLNQGQYTVLSLLNKFRFGTTDLLATALNKKNGTFIHSRLKILADQQYIGRHYQSSYRLQGQYASYYLLPAGGRALQQLPGATGINIKALYKNKTHSEAFIQHCLDVFAIHNLFKRRYDGSLKYFIKHELVTYDYFPQPLPDAYVRLVADNGARQYFLNLCHASQPYFTLIRKIKAFFEYADSGDWDVTDTELPVMLLVCDSYPLQRRLQKLLTTLIDESSDNVRFALTTKTLLLSNGPNVWQLADEPDVTVPLEAIS